MVANMLLFGFMCFKWHLPCCNDITRVFWVIANWDKTEEPATKSHTLLPRYNSPCENLSVIAKSKISSLSNK